MMKYLVAIIAIFTISNTAQAQATTALAKGSYSIKYGGTYKIDGKPDTKQFSIIDSGYNATYPFVENINLIVSDITGYTPKTYADYAKTFLPSKIKGFKVLEEKEVKQGGKTGYYLVFKGKQGNDALKWKQMYFVEKGKLYTVTFTAEETYYTEAMKSVSAMLASFTVK